MNNNYLIEYTDTYSLNKKIESIKKNITTSFEETCYDLEDNPLEDAIEDLDTYGLLSNKKLIIIKNIDLLKQDDKDTNHLLKYLDNPNDSNILILLSNKLDNRKKLTKTLISKTNHEKINSNKKEIIRNILGNYKITDQIIDTIIEYSSNNIDAIYNECEKLSNYKGNDKNITQEDLTKILYRHQTDESQILFDLIKDIAVKDKKNALKKHQELKSLQIEDMSIIALLESQLRIMLQTSILKNKHYKKQEIATKLNVHPYRIEKTLELLYNISQKEIIKILKDLSDLDYNIKSGNINMSNCMEMFIIKL